MLHYLGYVLPGHTRIIVVGKFIFPPGKVESSQVHNFITNKKH